MQNNTVSSMIRGIGAAVPEKVLTNAYLEKIVDTTDQWIQERTGMKVRHIGDDKGHKAYLGAEAARKALDDAQTATPEGLLVDEKSDTLVVLGDRGRTHFFTRAGRLVSSVRYKREAIERKLKLELWRPASAKEAGTFRGKLTSERRRD